MFAISDVLPQVTHSSGLKIDLKKIKLINRTLVARCRLFLLLGGFGAVLRFFRRVIQKTLRTAPNHPEAKKRRQRATKVRFSSFIFFKIHF